MFKTFNELATWAGIKGSKQNRKIKKALPADTFEHVKTVAGNIGAAVYLTMVDRLSTKVSGPKGDLFMTIPELAEWTGFDAADITTGLVRLAQANMLAKVTSDGRFAA